MRNDPIVEQARRAGTTYIKKCGGLAAAVADLQRRTEIAQQAGRKVISLSARPSKRKNPAK